MKNKSTFLNYSLSAKAFKSHSHVCVLKLNQRQITKAICRTWINWVNTFFILFVVVSPRLIILDKIPKSLCGVRFKGSHLYAYIWTQYNIHTNTAVLSWWQIFSTHRCWRMALNTHSVPCLQRLRNNKKLTRMRKETQMSLQWSVEGRQCLQTLKSHQGQRHYTLHPMAVTHSLCS